MTLPSRSTSSLPACPGSCLRSPAKQSRAANEAKRRNSFIGSNLQNADESPCSHALNQNRPSFPLPAEHRSRQRQSVILLPVPSLRLNRLATDAKKVSRRDLPQVGILHDLVRPRTCPLREIPFRQRLQPPGNPPEQMLPMPGPSFLLKHFAKLLPQACQTRPAQTLNFHQYRVIHRSGFLSVTVNHSHMNALCGHTSKVLL